MKLIDWEKKGNLVRLYFCNDKDYNNAYGDDWNDTPYEHNAGKVYDEYIAGYFDVCFNYEVVVAEPGDDWTYGGNSPYCKNDLKNRLAPCIVAVKPQEQYYWDTSDYHSLALMSEDNHDIIKLYLGTSLVDFVLDNDMVAWTNFVVID